MEAQMMRGVLPKISSTAGCLWRQKSDRKSTRLNSSHLVISYAVFCLKKKTGWLQAWVKINPVTYLSNAVRGLIVGGPVASPAWHALAWIAGILVVFAPLAVTLYRRWT